jgi:hypothetical protein
MPKTKSLKVTLELLESLSDLKKAMRDLPDGEAKKKARAALKKLSLALEGEAPLPKKGSSCPAGYPLV